MGKWLILGVWQEIHKMSLEHRIASESKKTLKEKITLTDT